RFGAGRSPNAGASRVRRTAPAHVDVTQEFFPMRHNKITKLGLAAAICAMTAAPGLAMAQAANQERAQAQDQYQAPGDAGDVSDEKLRSYVKATGKLYQIDTEWQPKLQGATDQERAAMEREIQTRMVAV